VCISLPSPECPCRLPLGFGPADLLAMPIGAEFLAMAIEAGLTSAITPARRFGGLTTAAC
jgi:hypothetical protein